MKPTTKGLAIGMALALAWAIFLATSGQVTGVGELERPTLGISPVAPLADFQWLLFDVDGNPVKLSEFQGRTIVLNTWATWCPPCLKEIPSLSKLAENPRIKDKKIVVLCVSTDESPLVLKSFLKDKPWKMKVVRTTYLPPAFQSEFIPATFIIAPDGRIVTTHSGPAQWDDPAVIDFLEKVAGK